MTDALRQAIAALNAAAARFITHHERGADRARMRMELHTAYYALVRAWERDTP